jgi:hypothetical protein
VERGVEQSRTESRLERRLECRVERKVEQGGTEAGTGWNRGCNWRGQRVEYSGTEGAGLGSCAGRDDVSTARASSGGACRSVRSCPRSNQIQSDPVRSGPRSSQIQSQIQSDPVRSIPRSSQIQSGPSGLSPNQSYVI